MHTSGHFSFRGIYSEDYIRYENSPPAPTSPFPSTSQWTPRKGAGLKTASDPSEVIEDFLCKPQDEIASEAKRLLAQRVAE